MLLDKFDCFFKKKKTHISFNTHQKGKYNVRDVNLLQHSYLQAQHLHISTRINQQQPASIISILRCKSAAIIVFRNAHSHQQQPASIICFFYMFLLRHYTCVAAIGSRNLSIRILGNISILRGKSAAITVFRDATLSSTTTS